MFYSELENKYIQYGTQFTLNGITYPAQWLYQATLEEKQEIGLQEVVEVNERKSDKFYFVTEKLEGATRIYENIPKDLDILKEMLANETKNTAYSLLQPTDYIDIRNLRDPSYKPEWITWRESVRQVSAEVITMVEAATDIEELEQISAQWPEKPE